MRRMTSDPHAGHDHGDYDDHEDGISVDAFKIIMLFCMILCVGLGIIPKFWGACQRSENVLSFLNCFSAGIFLAMALVHMMPEAAEIYQAWALMEGIERAFPLPYVGFFMGYMLILGIDRVAARAYHLGHGHAESKSPGKAAAPQAEMASIKEQPAIMASEDMGTKAPDSGRPLHPQREAEQKAADGTTVSKASAIILVLALGAHAFFEGIAFGLQTEIESAGQLAAGILIHKSAAAISLGGAFARTGYTTRQIILFLAIFSVIAPLGIIIGMQIAESNQIVDTIFMSISGGTFIYVACSEIIVGEFDKGSHQWVKMLLVFLGGLLITVLWFFGGHAHDHGAAADPHAGHNHLL